MQTKRFTTGKEMEEELNKVKNLKQGWRTELNDALNQTVVIDVSTTFNEAVDEMKKKYKEVKTQLDEQKPLLMKIGFDFEKNDFLSPLNPTEAMKQLQNSYIKALDDEKNLGADFKPIKEALKHIKTFVIDNEWCTIEYLCQKQDNGKFFNPPDSWYWLRDFLNEQIYKNHYAKVRFDIMPLS